MMNKTLTPLLLLGLMCFCSAPAVHAQITDLRITSYDDAGNACGSGWNWINQDLNEGVSGKFIYMCTKSGSGNPLTGISFTSNSVAGDRCSSGWGHLDRDLNEGSGGNFIYLCYQRGGSAPIDAIHITSSDSSGDLCWDRQGLSSQISIGGDDGSWDWTRVNVDLNHSVGGKYIYLCIGRHTEFVTPSDVQIQQLSDMTTSVIDFEITDSFQLDLNLARNSWQEQILGKLDSHLSFAPGNGYSPTNAQWVQTLSDDGLRNHHLTLRSGYAYVFGAVCDSDCNDVDLALYSPSGETVEFDASPSSTALFSARNLSTGRYRLAVRMAECTTSSCYYGVRVAIKSSRTP